MKVRLLEKPNGYTSRHYALTIGNVYEVVDVDGSCWVLLDDREDQAHVYTGRCEVIEEDLAEVRAHVVKLARSGNYTADQIRSETFSVFADSYPRMSIWYAIRQAAEKLKAQHD